MAMDNLVALLLRLPIFAGLKPLQLAEIVDRAERLRFWPGDLLTKVGQPGDGAYLIVAGPAHRVAGPGLATVPEPIVPGSLIGETAMLVEHDYGSTIIARDRVFCLKLMRSAMQAQMREDATLAEHFRDHLTERLLQAAEELRRIDRGLADAPVVQPATAIQPATVRFVAATGAGRRWGSARLP